MDIQAAASYVVAIIAVALLAWFDPKRRPGLRGSVSVRRLRMLLFAALVAPGFVLIAQARPATFIIWLGIVCVAGWGAAHAARIDLSG